MAENKKSVILYCDIIHTVEELSDQEAGILFKHYLRYINDLNPVEPDKLTKIVFEPIKQALKRDLKKWESIIEKRSLAGTASAEKRKQNKHMLTHVKNVEQTPTNPTVSDNVNVNVSVSEINNPPEKIFSIEECLLIALRDQRWVNANKATRQDLETFNKVLEGRGQYEKNAADYKNHYHNWVKGGKKDDQGFISKDQTEADKILDKMRKAKAQSAV